MIKIFKLLLFFFVLMSSVFFFQKIIYPLPVVALIPDPDPLPDDYPPPPPEPINPNPLDKCADPNYRLQDPVGCMSERSGGGGEPGVGYLFYCAKPGNPTGLDPWHVCTDSDLPSSFPSPPPGGACFGGWAYDKRDGCVYMTDPCQAEFFGDTSGLCRGENWEELVAGCRIINEGTENEGCEKFGFAELDPCIHCEYHNARYRPATNEWEPAYCAPMRNRCCAAGSEGSCNSIPGCWWNCPAGTLVTPTPTPIPAPNCKNLTAPSCHLANQCSTVPLSFIFVPSPRSGLGERSAKRQTFVLRLPSFVFLHQKRVREPMHRVARAIEEHERMRDELRERGIEARRA